MNNPSAQAIDIAEQREWLLSHKGSTASSWTELAKRINIPHGTLSQFGTGSYAGDNQRIADAIYRFRQHLASQAQVAAEAPIRPSYFETETSRQLCNMLRFAQAGRVVVAAMGAGTSKTSSAEHYAACFPHVYLITLCPSSAGVANMQSEALAALGEPDAVGTPQKLSRRIRDKVKGKGALMIFDEAQHASEKAIEEIRSWHDATGVGIALLGNVKVLQQLEGGSRAAAYAQLYSRVSLRLTRLVPTIGDVDAFADAWEIFDDAARLFLRRIGMLPGGLRGATFTVELAHMMARASGQMIGADHLQDAWAQLSSRPVAA